MKQPLQHLSVNLTFASLLSDNLKPFAYIESVYLDCESKINTLYPYSDGENIDEETRHVGGELGQVCNYLRIMIMDVFIEPT